MAVKSPRIAVMPLALATMATQASIVVLAPIVVEIGRDLDASVSAVGQARSILAATGVVASFAVGPMIDRRGVRPLLLWGSALALAGAAAAGAAPSLLAFFLAQLLVGAGVACLASAGFAGVAAFFGENGSSWAMGYVVGSQSISWIVGVPVIGVLTDAVTWRLAFAVPALASLLALLAGLFAPATAAAAARSHGARGSAAGASETGASPAEASAPGAARGLRGGLAQVARDPSARRWTLAELVAYAAWTAELTYAGAFYIQTYGVSESVVGLLLAVGSIAFLAATLGTDRLARRLGRRPLIVGGALGMGTLLVPVMNVTPSVWFTLALFCVMATFAGFRSTGSSSLGLAQLPDQPGSMMAARTASSQLGYMIGAAAGGLVLALADFGTLGFVLFAGMACSAALVAGVTERESARTAPLPAPQPARD